MKLLHYGKDGGGESTVWGFWLIEWKKLFSIAVLRFENGSRDAYHNHAFNAISWVLSGKLVECPIDGNKTVYKPSFRPIWTPRSMFHKVLSEGRTWVLTFRGSWVEEWNEYLPEEGLITLQDGRRRVA